MSYPTTARRRLARASMAAAIACALLAGTAFAAIPPKGPAAAPPPAGTTVDRAALPIGAAARAQLRLTRALGPTAVFERDARTGTPRIVAKLGGFLTGRSDAAPTSVALGFVRTNRAAFGLARADLRTLRLRKDYVDIGGTHHLSYVQRAGGLSVFGHGLEAAVTAEGRLVNVTGAPVHGVRVSGADLLGRTRAIQRARASAGGEAVRIRGDRAEKVLFLTRSGLRISWRTSVWVNDELRLIVIDAATGDSLWDQSMTQSDAVGSGIAVEYYPGDDVPLSGGIPAPVTFPVADGTALSGDNAHVYTDVNDDDTADPKDEVGAISGLDFSYAPLIDTTNTAQNCSTHFYCTWDKTVPKDWKRNRKFFAVQLYHYLNTFHDHLLAAPIGFTQAAGNFEVDNESGMGLGGDPVQGQALDGANLNGGKPDGAHVNNANMSTSEDGVPPVMQMFLQRATPYWPTIPSGDSGTEADTVYHEYGHGLSNRLVTYPDGTPALNSQQAGSMGEAWSDWYAIDYGEKAGYVIDTPASGDVVLYPYSSGDLLAFRTAAVDCPVGEAGVEHCPGPDTGAGDGGYTYGDLGEIIGFPEVHADGEIWVQALWDLRTAIGTNVSERLVTRGMELSPPDPSFLDMRNAIIQADVVASGGTHVDEIWQVFARRGMGYYASSISGDDVEVVEDFELPPDCAVQACGSISGTVTDSVNGDPIEGLSVAIAGLNTAGGLSDVTDASGEYAIEDVPFHVYPSLVFDGSGYEPSVARNVKVVGDVVRDRSLTRDWASLEGGATLKSFTPPDYGPFCGTNANGAFDLSFGAGWPSDSVTNGSSGVSGPRKTVVQLPTAVDVSTFGVVSGGTCGDGPEAGVKAFTIETRKNANAPWRTAVTANAPSDGQLHAYTPTAGTAGVRFVRFTMRSNHGDANFMDVLEVTVRGTT